MVSVAAANNRSMMMNNNGRLVRYCWGALLVALIVAAALIAEDASARQGRGNRQRAVKWTGPNGLSCARQPKNCCDDWMMITDPKRHYRETGCSIRCCEMKAAQRSLRSSGSAIEERPNYLSLSMCLMKLLQKLMFKDYDIPASCCAIPTIRQKVPACGGGGGAAAGAAPGTGSAPPPPSEPVRLPQAPAPSQMQPAPQGSPNPNRVARRFKCGSCGQDDDY